MVSTWYPPIAVVKIDSSCVVNKIHATHFQETMLSTLAGFMECGNGSRVVRTPVRLPARLPVMPDRPSRPLNKEIFKRVRVYSRYFKRIFRDYVQYVWFVPDVMNRTARPLGPHDSLRTPNMTTLNGSDLRMGLTFEWVPLPYL
jgi:hypothetical protein